jgi:hypothetical protein
MCRPASAARGPVGLLARGAGRGEGVVGQPVQPVVPPLAEPAVGELGLTLAFVGGGLGPVTVSAANLAIVAESFGGAGVAVPAAAHRGPAHVLAVSTRLGGVEGGDAACLDEPG